MKQTQEMIKATLKAFKDFCNDRYFEHGVEPHEKLVDLFLSQPNAEFLQAQQEESEAGKWIDVNDRLPQGFWDDRPLKKQQRGMEIYSEQVIILASNGKTGAAAYNRETKKWFVGDLMPEHYMEFSNTSVTHWQPFPAPVIESPPSVEKKDRFFYPHIEQERELGKTASVEEKGEGEHEHDWIHPNYNIDLEYCSICNAERKAQINNNYIKPDETPSVKEEDAEGVPQKIINQVWEHHNGGKTILDSMRDGHTITPIWFSCLAKEIIYYYKEYAARDYKSAKGMEVKFPSQYWLDHEFDWHSEKEAAEITINEIRRLNDPQGEGR